MKALEAVFPLLDQVIKDVVKTHHPLLSVLQD
jgi:hypothetical protein